ncbi:PREDICTED: nuclear envelope pore membrane protein POM 121-like [Lipotes vexillifer]|uniref:Nuclear envelope pore membrane protein POM 121-like n=1 Tax=Lipotes vexillifer TaxID=118797 RepID=A0A340XKD0_LIPVE|nr:PREDICTED: nuclear envelope pore membrane protein POM 121-like [Lipotes vexillifer]
MTKWDLPQEYKEAATFDREHPNAPAPAFCPGHSLSYRDRVPLSPGFYIAPKMQYPIQQARYSQLGMLPLASWRDSPKKPVLSARNYMMFGHSRTIKISPPGRKFTLLRSPPEQVVKLHTAPCFWRGQVLGEDHRPSSSGSLMSGKETQCEKCSDIPSRSSPSLVSTSSRLPCHFFCRCRG